MVLNEDINAVRVMFVRTLSLSFSHYYYYYYYYYLYFNAPKSSAYYCQSQTEFTFPVFVIDRQGCDEAS